MAELNCETDFVAKNEGFPVFLKDVCMQVAATKPAAIKREDIPSQIVEEQKDIYGRGQVENLRTLSKKIIAGKMDSFYKERCLLEQPL